MESDGDSDGAIDDPTTPTKQAVNTLDYAGLVLKTRANQAFENGEFEKAEAAFTYVVKFEWFWGLFLSLLEFQVVQRMQRMTWHRRSVFELPVGGAMGRKRLFLGDWITHFVCCMRA
jgi:hypothetical protein